VNNGQENWYAQGRQADADLFDFGSLLRVVQGAVIHHRWIVLGTCALMLFAATVYVVVWPPVYRAEAQIVAERDLDPSRDVFYANWQVFRKADARDEVVLFTSGPVLREVIERNDLTYAQVHHSFFSHASYLWQESWLGGRYSALKDWISPNPNAPTEEQKDRGRTLGGLQSAIQIKTEQDSHIANVIVRGPNAQVADLANSVIDTYLEYRASQFTEEARTAFEVLSAEVDRAQGELDDVVARREAFAAENGLLVEIQKQLQDVQELSLVEKNVANLEAQISALGASITEVESQLRAEPPEKVLASVRELNPVRENAKLRRLTVQTQLIGLRSRYREDSPEVRDALSEIEKLDALIASEPEQIDRSVTAGVNENYATLTASRNQLRSQLEGARASLGATQRTESGLRDRLEMVPPVLEAKKNLDREYGVASAKLERLQLRRMEADVSLSATGAAPASVRVVDYATPPMSKAWPKLKYFYPAALIFGLGLGVVAAVLRSLTAGRFLRSHLDRGRIAGPIYATIALRNGSPRLAAFDRAPFALSPGGGRPAGVDVGVLPEDRGPGSGRSGPGGA
jgi:uncharacterized protein involved in exopolysaccharide biosynthesis